MLLYLALGLLLFIRSSSQDKSTASISSQGLAFIPADSSHPPILSCTTKSLLYCQFECNKRIDCRTFDFDGDSRQCRLWDADATTGSIVASSSKPRSSVGTIQISANIYVNSHNKPCDTCVLSRYETCDANSSTCQCPSNTFWNGSMCLTQLFKGQVCSQPGTCRSDLNLTCEPSCDATYRCAVAPAMGVGQTVGGYCNSTTDGSSFSLNGPWGIYVSQSDGTLYVADYHGARFLAFPPCARIGLSVLSVAADNPSDIFVDSSGTMYMSDYSYAGGTVFIQRDGIMQRIIPAAGQSSGSCLFTGLDNAYGIAADRSGNMYVGSSSCAMVVKWAPNATTGVLFAGIRNSVGSTNENLNWPRFFYLDQNRSALYVVDSLNNRIQRFMLGGNGTGVTVAGNNGAGTALNQLNGPAGVWITQDGQTVYITDYGNHRIMKWTIGATQGSLVAGSLNGTAGNTNLLLNGPGDLALDPNETYLYVSDYHNHRVQRFRLE